jgi:hypothetical protein
MNESARDVRELRPDCPAPLAALVMHCLAKNPADRPPTADDAWLTSIQDDIDLDADTLVRAVDDLLG